MPINRNALIRYKTIDRMLRGGKQATLEEMIDSCSDALLDYCGQANISRRTIQYDVQTFHLPLLLYLSVILIFTRWRVHFTLHFLCRFVAFRRKTTTICITLPYRPLPYDAAGVVNTITIVH